MQRRVEDYRGRVIAVDASLSIYQFLVSRRARPLYLFAPFASVSSQVVAAFGYSATRYGFLAARLDFSDDVTWGVFPVSNLVRMCDSTSVDVAVVYLWVAQSVWKFMHCVGSLGLCGSTMAQYPKIFEGGYVLVDLAYAVFFECVQTLILQFQRLIPLPEFQFTKSLPTFVLSISNAISMHRHLCI